MISTFREFLSNLYYFFQIFDGPSKDDYLLGTHCRNQLPPSYVSTGNEMLIVMRSDSIISAKGFKATYKAACGARIIVKDQGFLAESSSNILNCTWILVAENPGELTGLWKKKKKKTISFNF